MISLLPPPYQHRTLLEIAHKPVPILNIYPDSLVRLTPHLRSWMVAVTRSGEMYAVEGMTKAACRSMMEYWFTMRGRPAYLIYVRPK